MPTYGFKCLKCKKNKKKDFPFDAKMSIAEYNEEAPCPKCGNISKTRIYDVFAIHEGLNRSQKESAVGGLGAMRNRVDTGKYMKDEKDKRKRNAAPGSRDAISNEYWTGTEVERKVISGPDKNNAGAT